MISVIVEEKVKEGQLEAFVEYMAEMIAITRQEDGCIAYGLHEAVDGSGSVVMIESWESKEALDRHMESEHFKKFVPGSAVYKAEDSVIRVFGSL